jgi:hypothetical protein
MLLPHRVALLKLIENGNNITDKAVANALYSSVVYYECLTTELRFRAHKIVNE